MERPQQNRVTRILQAVLLPGLFFMPGCSAGLSRTVSPVRPDDSSCIINDDNTHKTAFPIAPVTVYGGGIIDSLTHAAMVGEAIEETGKGCSRQLTLMNNKVDEKILYKQLLALRGSRNQNINLSLEIAYTKEQCETIIGHPVTDISDLSKYYPELKKAFASSPDTSERLHADILEVTQELARYNTITVATGNDNNQKINILALVPGTVPVTATSQPGKHPPVSGYANRVGNQDTGGLVEKPGTLYGTIDKDGIVHIGRMTARFKPYSTIITAQKYREMQHFADKPGILAIDPEYFTEIQTAFDGYAKNADISYSEWKIREADIKGKYDADNRVVSLSLLFSRNIITETDCETLSCFLPEYRDKLFVPVSSINHIDLVFIREEKDSLRVFGSSEKDRLFITRGTSIAAGREIAELAAQGSHAAALEFLRHNRQAPNAGLSRN